MGKGASDWTSYGGKGNRRLSIGRYWSQRLGKELGLGLANRSHLKEKAISMLGHVGPRRRSARRRSRLAGMSWPTRAARTTTSRPPARRRASGRRCAGRSARAARAARRRGRGCRAERSSTPRTRHHTGNGPTELVPRRMPPSYVDGKRRAQHMAAHLAPLVDEQEPRAQHPHSLFQGSAGALAL